MTSPTHSRWLLSFAAIQALGAIVGVVAFFLNASAPLWSRLVWSILAVALVGICIGMVANARRPAAVGAAYNEAPQALSKTIDALPTPNTRRLHYFIPLLLWSALASMVVVFMSNHRTGLVMVSLAPIWIGGLAIMASAAFRDRQSAVIMAVLCCGLVGAWLGSDG